MVGIRESGRFMTVCASLAAVVGSAGVGLAAGSKAEARVEASQREAGALAASVLESQPTDDDGASGAEAGGASLEEIASKYRTGWNVQVEPLLWYWSPSGRIRLPATSGSGGASAGGFGDSGSRVKVAELNLDSPRFSPAGEVHLSIDRFRVSFSGAGYEINRDQSQADESFRLGASEVVAGDTLDVDFEFITAELTLGYNVWSKDFAADTDASRGLAAKPLVLRTYLLGGVRMYHTDISVRNVSAGTSADASEWFAEPILGARAEVEINEVFTIDLQLSGGYWADSDKSASSIDVAVGFMYRPHPNVGLQIGWRQVAFDLNDGEGVSEFEFDGRMAGVYGGIVLRF